MERQDKKKEEETERKHDNRGSLLIGTVYGNARSLVCHSHVLQVYIHAYEVSSLRIPGNIPEYK